MNDVVSRVDNSARTSVDRALDIRYFELTPSKIYDYMTSTDDAVNLMLTWMLILIDKELKFHMYNVTISMLNGKSFSVNDRYRKNTVPILS